MASDPSSRIPPSPLSFNPLITELTQIIKIPGQELLDAIDRMICNAFEHDRYAASHMLQIPIRLRPIQTKRLHLSLMDTNIGVHRGLILIYGSRLVKIVWLGLEEQFHSKSNAAVSGAWIDGVSAILDVRICKAGEFGK